jgi:hypothetical protein
MDQNKPSASSATPSTSLEIPSKTKKYIFGAGLVLLVIVIAGVVFAFHKSTPEVNNSQTVATSSGKTLTFNGHSYVIGNILPIKKDNPAITNESYEWVTGKETVETWTSLITTHKIHSTSSTTLSPEAYAQSAAGLQQKQGALILETSLVNQDSAALGIDPANPPYLIVYLYNQDGVSEFDMQKIQKLPNGDIGAMIYAERFPTKSQADMKTYYESPERAAKRIELIKAPFPY